MNTNAHLDEYQIKRLKDCCFTIQDNLNAIITELESGNAFKYYILEKTKPMLSDLNCIISNCEVIKEDNTFTDDIL